MFGSETEYRQALREHLKGEVYPRAHRIESGGAFPHDIVRGLGAAGFFASCLRHDAPSSQVPLEVGFFRVLIEELAKTGCFGLTLSVSMHVGVFTPLVARLAHPAQRDALVARATAGEILGTLAATELESAGSDLMGMQTAAEFRDGGIVLTGAKHYITNAAVADCAVVFARWRPGRHFTNFCALLVPLEAPGVERARIPMAVMTSAAVSRMCFAGVELPPTGLLGRKELGIRYFLEHIAFERLSGGIWAVAAAEQCLEEAQRHAHARVVGEETLWERGSVRHRVAEAVVQVTLLRGLVDRVVEGARRTGTLEPLESAVMKASLGPCMESVIGRCLQLQGARGLEADSLLLRLLNDFRVFGVAGGSTETMLDVIAEQWAQRAAHAAPPAVPLFVPPAGLEPRAEPRQVQAAAVAIA